MTDWIEHLERLQSLKEQGHLSASEYKIAKARILGKNHEHAVETDEQSAVTLPSNFTSESDTKLGDKTPLAKRLLIAVALILPTLFGSSWAIGKLAANFGGDIVPDPMLQQCVGVGAGNEVMRPFNQSFDVFVAGIRASGIEPVDWEATGDDAFNLHVRDGDKAKRVREEGVYVIRKMTGNGGLPNCGPDTLRVDRVLVNDQDLGVKGLEGVLFTLMQGMQAMNIKPEESTREPIAQLKTVAPPSKKIDQYSQLAAMPRSAHPQSSSFSLIGVWAPEGEYCASGAPTTFRSDGKVVEEFGAGAWNINGEKLTILMNGETTKSTIRLISDDDIFAYWDEGGSTRYRRCPVTQDDEPWFPV